MAETVEGKTYLPNDFGDRSGGIEGESARICERLAAHALSQEDRRPRLVTGDDSIELSAGMVDVLRRARGGDASGYGGERGPPAYGSVDSTSC